MKTRRKMLSLLISICTLMTFVFSGNVVSYAAEPAATITLETEASMAQGSTNRQGKVYISSLSNVASINVKVYYDEDVVTNIQFLAPTGLYTNYDLTDQDGCISLSGLLSGNGADQKTQLFQFSYEIKSNAPVGKKSFDVLVEEAYDKSLNPMDITGGSVYYTITKSVAKTATIYGTSTINSQKGQEFELSYTVNAPKDSSGNNAIATGAIEIHYDRDLFEFVSLTKQNFFDNKTLDINTEMDGTVFVTFLSTKYNNGSNLFKIKFKTIANVTDTSAIQCNVTELYGLDLNEIIGKGCTTNVKLTYDSTFDDSLPTMNLSSSLDAVNNQLTVKVKLDANSNLGAIDGVISWNSEVLSYVSSEEKLTTDFFNINTKHTDEGVLKFSIISMTGITAAAELLEIKFDISTEATVESTPITITGDGITDSVGDPISLNFVNVNATITHTHNFESKKVNPSTSAAGYTEEVCSICKQTRNHQPLYGRIASANVSLGADLTITYAAQIYGEYLEGAYMVFTRDGEETKVTSCKYNSSTDRYEFEYQNIAPQFMADNIKAELFLDIDQEDTLVGTIGSYSIRTFCNNRFKNVDDAQKSLMADLLEYGAEAQNYTGHNTEDLANSLSWVSEYKTTTFDVPATDKKVTVSATDKTKYRIASAELILGNVNTLLFRIQTTDLEGLTVEMKRGDVNKGTWDVSKLKYDSDNNNYQLSSDGIYATGYADIYTITLKKNDEIVHQITYSANSFVTSKHADASVGNIVKAMYKYGASAKSFSESK